MEKKLTEILTTTLSINNREIGLKYAINGIEKAYSPLKEQHAKMTYMLERLTLVLTDIDSTLFHHNHEVAGWHLNGDHEPMMNFVADLDMDALSDAQTLLSSIKKVGSHE